MLVRLCEQRGKRGREAERGGREKDKHYLIECYKQAESVFA